MSFKRKIGPYLLSGILILILGAAPALSYILGEFARVAGGAVKSDFLDVAWLVEFGLSILGIYFVFGYFLYHFSNSTSKSIVIYSAVVIAALGKYLVWGYLWMVRGDLAARFNTSVTPREPHFQLVILLLALIICLFLPSDKESYSH